MGYRPSGFTICDFNVANLLDIFDKDANIPKYLLKFVDSDYFENTCLGYIHVQPISNYSSDVSLLELTAAQRDMSELSLLQSIHYNSDFLLFVGTTNDFSKSHFVRPAINKNTGKRSYNFTENYTYRFPIIQKHIDNILIGSYYGLNDDDYVIVDGVFQLKSECIQDIMKSKLNITAKGASRSYVIYDFRMLLGYLYNNIAENLEVKDGSNELLTVGFSPIVYYDTHDKDVVDGLVDNINDLLSYNEHSYWLEALLYLVNRKQEKYSDQKEVRLLLFSKYPNLASIMYSFFNSSCVMNDISKSIIYKAPYF